MTRGRGISGVFQRKVKLLPWPLLLIFLFLITAIILSGLFYYQKQKKTVFNEQITQLKAIGDLKAAEIPFPHLDLAIPHLNENKIAGFDAANQKSLGLQLVTMMTKQLEGSLAIKSSGGTSVHIIFSNNEKNEKQS